jgi:microcin C transport system ATP-binding protein
MADRLLTVTDLGVRFGTTDAVKGISFHIDHGEIVAIVGESGSGKSASALSILQLLPYPLASHPTGSITLDGMEILGASRADLRSIRGAKVSMIFQEPMTSLNPLHTVGKQIGEVMRVHQNLSKQDAAKKSFELLERVQLPDPAAKLGAYPHELSGGQRQRVMIAMALANEPSLLIADEPTTALDVTIQASILDLLRDLNRDLDMAVLLISHDLAIVENMASRVYVMTEGEVVEEGSVENVFHNPKHDYTKHLIGSRPRGTPPPVKTGAEVVLSTDNLCVNYTVGKGWFGRANVFQAVKGVSLNVREGETVGVVGESGSGKTSLGLGILRLIKSDGPIVYLGDRIDEIPAKELKPLRKNLQIVFQDPYGSLSPRLSLREIIAEGLELHEPELSAEQVDERVRDALEEVDLNPEWLNRYPHEFSGGQRQRISLARAQILRPRFVILDEPTSALDMSVQAQIVNLLRELQQKHQLAYLFISHDLAVVRALSHTIVVMKDGEVVESGPADEVFHHPKSEYTRELLSAAMLED